MKDHRFLTLDAMRGLAAIAVVFYHLNVETAHPSSVFRSGFLAVDLFFALSGFVLSGAYSRLLLSSLSSSGFMKRRVLRLWPMLIIGVSIGTLAAVSLGAVHDFRSALELVGAVGAALLLLPVPFQVGAIHDLYPIDGPSWSLFFELFANLVFAMGIRRFTVRILWWIVIPSALVVASLVMVRHTVHMGMHINSFFYGFPRVLFSFFAGVLLQRRFPNGLPGAPVPLLLLILLAALAVPVPHILRPVYDCAFVFVLSPLLIVFGAGSVTQWTWLRTTAHLVGAASYPLYLIHMPILLAVAAFAPIEGLPMKLGLVAGLVFVATLLGAAEPALRRRLGTMLNF